MRTPCDPQADRCVGAKKPEEKPRSHSTSAMVFSTPCCFNLDAIQPHTWVRQDYVFLIEYSRVLAD
jgi:hypothetical protein